jgi:PilZ domain
VLIASAELLPRLRDRTGGEPAELLSFTDVDALRALEAITSRKPEVVAIEQEFATTPRGAALINRIKADPVLALCEIRIVSLIADPVSVGRGKPSPAASPAAPALDQRGTRRAPRFRVSGQVEVLVDGNLALLVDLSVIGAQVLSPTVLKPNQRVRMALSDEHSSVRFNAGVAWASFEIPKNTNPRYRAGIEFIDADKAAVNAYLARHKQI